MKNKHYSSRFVRVILAVSGHANVTHIYFSTRDSSYTYFSPIHFLHRDSSPRNSSCTYFSPIYFSPRDSSPTKNSYCTYFSPIYFSPTDSSPRNSYVSLQRLNGNTLTFLCQRGLTRVKILTCYSCQCELNCMTLKALSRLVLCVSSLP